MFWIYFYKSASLLLQVSHSSLRKISRIKEHIVELIFHETFLIILYLMEFPCYFYCCLFHTSTENARNNGRCPVFWNVYQSYFANKQVIMNNILIISICLTMHPCLQQLNKYKLIAILYKIHTLSIYLDEIRGSI